MFKNKHIIIAMIVAPILAIISYFAVDRMVSEKPHVAKQDASYPLAAKPGCRYASGECRLENGDVNIVLKPVFGLRNLTELELVSVRPIEGAKVAVVSGDDDGEPISFTSINQEKLIWSAELPFIGKESDQLRLVVFSGEAVFFAEVDTVFMQPPELAPQR